MITEEFKQRIIEALRRSRDNFPGSDTRFAVALGINKSQYNRIKKGETDKVISDQKWATIARRLGVEPASRRPWKTARTPVFEFITEQLEMCQRESFSALLCDLSDIGKTYTARHYARNHRNVVYCDCSQTKSKQRLVRYLAREFGIDSTGRYVDVYEDLVYYIKTLETPLIILDEAGDLQYDAFLEIKALWNATEMSCGWYMMGADGLQEKMRRSIDNKKVGYTEIFRRFGKRYGKVVPPGKNEGDRFLQATAAMIIKANGGSDVNKILKQTLGEDGAPSLSRIQKELSKTA